MTNDRLNQRNGRQGGPERPEHPYSKTARRRGDYSDAEVEKALIALAMCSGNASRASRELEGVGFKISRTTLSTWKQSHAERYRELQEKIQPEINAEIAETSEALVRRITGVEWQAIEKIEEELPSMTGTQAATALQRLTWSKGVNADKSRTYRDLPIEIRRTDAAGTVDAMRVLVTKFPGVLPKQTEDHMRELVRWTDEAIESTAAEETADE
jgi:hypothetical protein